MSGWSLFQDEVRVRLDELRAIGCPDPFFRGHSESSWNLLPSISRQLSNPNWNQNKEARLFHQFRDMGTHLLPPNTPEWAVLFWMQHYGIPTRLLDWTTTFANGLYFALKHGGSSPTIWVLNPYELNDQIGTGRKLADFHRTFKMDYTQFLDLAIKPPGATACAGDYSVARIRHQRGNFTVHGDLITPLELFAPRSLSKHVLPPDAVDDAKEFLELSGVNEFQIFPDLDGLARHVCEFELGI